MSKENQKYYLRSWVNEFCGIVEDIFKDEGNYVNQSLDNGNLFIGSKADWYSGKVLFTQEEIDNLPKQDFIKGLVKEEFESKADSMLEELGFTTEDGFEYGKRGFDLYSYITFKKNKRLSIGADVGYSQALHEAIGEKIKELGW